MSDFNLLIAAIIICSLVGLWYSFSRARELAISSAGVACQKQGFQLLDQSVHLKSVSLKRNKQDNLSFIRGYQFDFSLNGHDRFPAYIILLGKKVEHIQFDHPEGRIIDSGYNRNLHTGSPA